MRVWCKKKKKNPKNKHHMFHFHSGNALGMIGVSSGIVATLGLLKPSLENFTQMAACMGAGNVNYTDFKPDQSKENNRKIDTPTPIFCTFKKLKK